MRPSPTPFSFFFLADTDTDDTALRRTLQSLAYGKKRVLRKVPARKDVHDGGVFQFNADFVVAFRVHINSTQIKETVRPLPHFKFSN